MFTEKFDGANIRTDGQGYFYGFTVFGGEQTTNAAMGAVADRVYARQFVLPFRITVRNIATEVISAGAASSKYGVALYDEDLNLLVETGALAADATGILRTSVVPVTLNPGVYWFCQTSDSTTVTARVFLISGRAMLNEGTVQKFGRGSNNAPDPGTFPSTLGTITVSLSNFPMVAIFEP